MTLRTLVIAHLLGMLLVVALVAAIAYAAENRAIGENVTIGGAIMHSEDFTTTGSIQTGPIGTTSVLGQLPVDPPDDPTTLRIVFKPEHHTTIEMQHGDSYALSELAPEPGAYSYLLWTK